MKKEKKNEKKKSLQLAYKKAKDIQVLIKFLVPLELARIYISISQTISSLFFILFFFLSLFLSLCIRDRNVGLKRFGKVTVECADENRKKEREREKKKDEDIEAEIRIEALKS